MDAYNERRDQKVNMQRANKLVEDYAQAIDQLPTSQEQATYLT